MHFWVGALLLLAILSSGVYADSTLTIRPMEDTARVEVIAALPERTAQDMPAGRLTQEQGERWLRLTLANKSRGEAILGNYERKERKLIFTPRHPLMHGERYRATFEIAKGKVSTADYQVPARKTSTPAVVEKVYPSAVVLPANVVKFYIHFSKPMREGHEIFDQITLLDEKGKPVADPWRRTELWSADARRLTLWVHPGRVKRGVNLREEFGPVLQSGHEYRLVVSATVRDAEGQPLGKPFIKKFRTSKEDRTRPLPELWEVAAPFAKGRDPLVLRFPKPLDRALLTRLVTVSDEQGNPVAGKIEVGPEERSWSFQPEKPWRAADYRVEVDEDFEDVAGNTPRRLFDVDLQEPTPEAPKLTIRFQPRIRK